MKDGGAQPQRDAGPSLEDALAETMDVQAPPEAHAERAFRLAFALTGATGGALALPDRDKPIFLGPEDKALAELARTALEAEDGRMRSRDRLALRFGNGAKAFAIALRITGGGAVLSVGWERLTLLSVLSAQRERLSGAGFDPGLVRSAATVAGGEWSAAQDFADLLRMTVGADAVAIAAFDDRALARFVVSDAPALAKAGAADDDLRDRLKKIGAGEADPEGARLGAPRDGYGILLIGCPEPETVWAALKPLFNLPRARRTVRSRLRRWFAPAIVALVIAGILVIPVPDSVGATAVVAPNERRVLTAPTAAPLREMLVAEGDIVRAGDPIATFETRDLELSLSEARARLASALAALQDARARRDEAGRRDVELEMAQIEARIDQYDALLDASTLLASINGVVAQDFGDQRIGSVFSVGEPVAEIFAQSDPHLEIWVSEQDIARVTLNAAASFRADADPENEIDIRITEISVVAKERDGVSVFKLLGEAPSGLSNAPGMTGVAALDSRSVTVGALVWDRMRKWLARRFWI